VRVLGAVAFGLALAACGGRAEPQAETAAEQARSVRIAIVQARPVDIGVTASGF
jgi:multidrug efflux pump subunit AcrA (membrane-fusion protein)